MSSALKDRKKDYKKGIDKDANRRRRQDGNVELRKSKKDEWIAKKRRGTADELDQASVQSAMAALGELRDAVFGTDLEAAVAATTEFRRLLSLEKEPPIDEVIACGVLPKFVEFLQADGNLKLQFEAAWSLTNIASGKSIHTREVVAAGAVPHLIRLLRSPSNDVKEQCVWAIGNVAGDSVENRNMVLHLGALDPICDILTTTNEPTLIRNATWALSNLCRGRPQPEWEWVRNALPALSVLLYTPDEDILIDACWAISYLSDGPGERVPAIIESGVVRRLVQLLMHNHPSVQTPALRTIGNVVTGDDSETQHVINCSALPSLLSLLAHPKRNIRKEACWTLSNITAGNEHQIQAVIEANIMQPLIQLLQYSADFAIRKEACWAISNATTGGTPEQIEYLVQLGCIGPLCEFLEAPDVRLVMVALEGLENILNAGEILAQQNNTTNQFAIHIEEAKGLQKIFNLQTHRNSQIYDKATTILDTYFEQVNDDEHVAPTTEGSHYGFGMTQTGPASFNFGGPK